MSLINIKMKKKNGEKNIFFKYIKLLGKFVLIIYDTTNMMFN